MAEPFCFLVLVKDPLKAEAIFDYEVAVKEDASIPMLFERPAACYQAVGNIREMTKNLTLANQLKLGSKYSNRDSLFEKADISEHDPVLYLFCEELVKTLKSNITQFEQNDFFSDQYLP